MEREVEREVEREEGSHSESSRSLSASGENQLHTDHPRADLSDGNGKRAGSDAA